MYGSNDALLTKSPITMKTLKLTFALLILTLGMNAQDTYERKFAGKKVIYTVTDSLITINFNNKSTETMRVKGVRKYKGVEVYDIVEGDGGTLLYRYTIRQLANTIKLQVKDDFSGVVTEDIFSVKKLKPHNYEINYLNNRFTSINNGIQSNSSNFRQESLKGAKQI